MRYRSVFVDEQETVEWLLTHLEVSNHAPVTTWRLFQGDWVWLKKFEEGQFKEVKQSTTRIFTKVERH